jgi:hypothetical protein
MPHLIDDVYGVRFDCACSSCLSIATANARQSARVRWRAVYGAELLDAESGNVSCNPAARSGRLGAGVASGAAGHSRRRRPFRQRVQQSRTLSGR